MTHLVFCQVVLFHSMRGSNYGLLSMVWVPDWHHKNHACYAWPRLAALDLQNQSKQQHLCSCPGLYSLYSVLCPSVAMRLAPNPDRPMAK